VVAPGWSPSGSWHVNGTWHSTVMGLH